MWNVKKYKEERQMKKINAAEKGALFISEFDMDANSICFFDTNQIMIRNIKIY